MNKVLVINLLSTKHRWSIFEEGPEGLKLSERHELPQPSAEELAEGEQSFLPVDLKFIATELKSKNLNYDRLCLLYDLRPQLIVNLELPFKEQKAIEQIIIPELEDRLAIEPENFFLQFKFIREIEPGKNEVATHLLSPSSLEALFSALSAAGLKADLATNYAGALTSVLAQIESEDSNLLAYQTPEGWHFSLRSNGHPLLEEGLGVAPITTSQQEQLLALKFRLKQLQMDYPKLNFLCLNRTDINALSQIGIEASPLRSNLFSETDEESAIFELAIARASLQPAARPRLNFCFGKYAANPLITAALAGLRRIAPAAVFAVLSLVFAGSLYYFVQAKRIEMLQAAVSQKISTTLNRSDLQSLTDVSTFNGILEEQLKSLGSPTSLNPADIFSELSQDLHKETDIKFTRLKIASNKAILDGIAPSYTAIDRIQRILKKRSSTYCEVSSRSSGAGSSPSFVIELQLCQK